MAEPVKLELALDRLERMLFRQHLHRSIGAEHQEPRALRAPPEERQPVQRRHIAPVQVLEPQDHRRMSRARGIDGDGFAELLLWGAKTGERVAVRQGSVAPDRGEVVSGRGVAIDRSRTGV